MRGATPVFALMVFLGLLANQMVLAQVPTTMSYQGVLALPGGATVPDDEYSISFRIYDVSSGGT
ncbi:MAG TPA: hypothetical protein VGA99_07670, partial [bacterium]